MKSLVRVESVSPDRPVFTATLFSVQPWTPVELLVTVVPAELRDAIAPGALFVASVHRAADEPGGWRLSEVALARWLPDGSTDPVLRRITAVCPSGHVAEDVILDAERQRPRLDTCPRCGMVRTWDT
ncbi:MAG: hypothetical protein ABSA52_23330 [Candidatus Binatia bacterium]|jgi:hypothetical protein